MTRQDFSIREHLCRWHARRQLRDAHFAFLFDPPPADEWVSIDCETSSLDPEQAEILSIAAVPVKGTRILLSQTLELTLKPSRPIAAQSIPIHQLRQQDVADGLPVRKAVTQLLQFVGARPLLGYYLEFDLAVLNRPGWASACPTAPSRFPACTMTARSRPIDPKWICTWT